MEIEMTGKIDMNELTNDLNTWVGDWLEGNIQSQLSDSLNIEEQIEEFMCNVDLSDYTDVNDYIDNDSIRYNIEDKILEQVNDYVDYDNIRYNIEDDIVESVESTVLCNFDINEHIDYDDIKSNCEIDELEDRTTELETKVEELEEIVAQLELVLAENPPRKVGLIRRFLGWLW